MASKTRPTVPAPSRVRLTELKVHPAVLLWPHWGEGEQGEPAKRAG